jgi:hypothetical protein
VRQLRDATIEELFEAVFSMEKSRVYLVGSQLPASKSVKTETTAFEAVTRQRLVNTEQTEKASCVLW